MGRPPSSTGASASGPADTTKSSAAAWRAGGPSTGTGSISFDGS